MGLNSSFRPFDFTLQVFCRLGKFNEPLATRCLPDEKRQTGVGLEDLGPSFLLIQDIALDSDLLLPLLVRHLQRVRQLSRVEVEELVDNRLLDNLGVLVPERVDNGGDIRLLRLFETLSLVVLHHPVLLLIIYNSLNNK